MATPGRAALTSLRARAYAPAIPEARATARSSRVGWVWAIISSVSSLKGDRTPMKAAMMTASATPLNTASMESRSSRTSLSTSPSEKAKMGDISGATSMAPMTTDPLLRSRPRVAIMHDRTISTK